MPIKFKVEVQARPEEAFAYVADLPRHGDWSNPKAGLRVEAVSEEPTGVGSKFRSSQKFLGKDTGADITITQYSAPRVLAFDAVQQGKKGPETYTNVFTFTPSDGGTRVERSIDRQPPMLAGILVYPAIRADAMKSLRRLKATLESKGS